MPEENRKLKQESEPLWLRKGLPAEEGWCWDSSSTKRFCASKEMPRLRGLFLQPALMGTNSSAPLCELSGVGLSEIGQGKMTISCWVR